MDILVDITGVTLETERLILRPWRETDLDDFFAYASVPGVGEMAGWLHHDSIETSKQILDAFISSKNMFAIVLKENGKAIGSLGLHLSWANDDPLYKNLRQKEIGYVLTKEFWGRGLMTEAVLAVIRFGFEVLKLDALTVGHFITNSRSQRVIEKCGFTLVKSTEHYAKQLDRSFKDLKYILLP